VLSGSLLHLSGRQKEGWWLSELNMRVSLGYMMGLGKSAIIYRNCISDIKGWVSCKKKI
jgi:hypothetical protein